MLAILRASICTTLILATGTFAFAQSRQQRVKKARRALDVLVKTQQPVGYWKAPQGSNRIRHTALAGYAMSAEGTSLLQGRYRRSFRKAVTYVSNFSYRRGFLRYRRDTDQMFGHAVAMLFLADAIGDTEDPDRLKELHIVLHKAVRFLAASQLSNGGWARDVMDKKKESASARVTALQLQGLLACRRAGVAVPQEPIDKGLRFLLSRQQTDGGIPELPGKISPSDPVASAATLLCMLQSDAAIAQRWSMTKPPLPRSSRRYVESRHRGRGRGVRGERDLLASRVASARRLGAAQLTLTNTHSVGPLSPTLSPDDALRDSFAFCGGEGAVWNGGWLCDTNLNQQRKSIRSERTGRKAKQHRILILAGGPSRDYRLVTRMLHADPRFRVDAWLQMTVPKFIKNVVQPVDQLLTAFPKAVELAKYDAVITFDNNWRELKKPDIAAFDAWVRKRGGGVVFRPGEVFGRCLAHEDQAVIARLFPGEVGDYLVLDTGAKRLTPARLQWSNVKSSPAGLPIKMLEKFFRPHTGSRVEKARASVKVFARSVEVGMPQIDSRILFSTHTAGKGRVFFCGTSETWRLRNTGDRHFERFWYGVLRYVIPSFSGELPKRRKPTPIDTKTAQGKAIVRLQAYCDRVLAAKTLTKMEHRSVAEWNYVRAVSLHPNASRIKTVNAIRKRLLNSQQADGSWKPGPVDPLKQSANAAILLHQASIRR